MELHINLNAIRANARRVQEMVDGRVIGVMKGVAAHRDVVEAVVDAGVDAIAVSQAGHLREFQDLDVERVMVRVPGPADVDQVVRNADITLHSSLDVLERAAREAKRQDMTHRIVPMVDAGDRREGIDPVRVAPFIERVQRMDRIELVAVGINRGCFGDRPDPQRIGSLIDDIPTYPVSVGGSSLLPIRNDLPDSVERFRIGDAMLTGKWEQLPIRGLTTDTVELRCDVLTRRNGEAVIDIGSVTTDPRALVPQGDFDIDRWSTEQAVVSGEFAPGESVSFSMEYEALARTCNTCGPDAIRLSETPARSPATD